MAIIFDPSTKRIILDSASVTATEIYSRSVDWLALSDNIKYGLVFRVAGGDDLGGGLSIPPYFFLQGSWRIRPMEVDHDLAVTGNLFVESGGSPFVRTLGPYQVSVRSTVPVAAQGISTSGGSSGPTASEVAAAVRIELNPELGHILTLENNQGMTPTQATMLLEIYRLYGLDPTKPLVVNNSQRIAGAEIIQNIQSNDTQTIITRV